MELLDKLFGSAGKVKIIKLFIFNPESLYDIKTIVKKTKTRLADVSKELSMLEKIDLIKRKDFKNGGERKVKGFTLNPGFVYTEEIKDFFIKVSPFTSEEVVKKLSKAGKIKAVIVSGVFLQEWEARVDMLVVGDRLKRNILEKTLGEIESELGKEIKYSVLDSHEFGYRLGVGDKLVRDILDYPHKIIFNKIGLVDGN